MSQFVLRAPLSQSSVPTDPQGRAPFSLASLKTVLPGFPVQNFPRELGPPLHSPAFPDQERLGHGLLLINLSLLS